MAFKITNLLFCLNALRATTVEILLIIFSSFGIILGILGIIFIPWKIVNSSIEVLFIIVLIFNTLSLILAAIILYLRNHFKLNKRVAKILIIAVIFMEFICFFILIFLIIIAFTLFSDLNKKERIKIIEEYEESNEYKRTIIKENDIASFLEKVITILFISLLIALSILYLLLWLSEYVRLIFGIEESYNEFVANENNRQLKHPIKYGLNVVGHDKYGFPIFGKQIGKKIKIKGVKSKFDEKKSEKFNLPEKYFDEHGKINIKYYSSSTIEPMTQEKIDEKICEKEQYLEKYFDGDIAFQNYSNFHNKTILNYDDNNNSINPGYNM